MTVTGILPKWSQFISGSVFWEYEGRFSSPLDWQCRLITVSNIVLIEIKINRNTKKERPFKNLNICILASPLALASAFTSTFQIFCFYLKSVWCMFFTVLDYSVSLCFVANAYYSTISRSSIQSLPLVF